MRKHHKICPIWTSSSYRFCERTFGYHKSRRAHERKSHKAQWNEGLEARLLAYQNGKGNKTIPPLKERTAANSGSLSRRTAAIAALEAMSCEPPLQEVQIPQACNKTPVTSIPGMVPRDECKSMETQNNITGKTPQFVVAPRSYSPGEDSSQIPGCSSWSPPPVVPRIVLSDITGNNTVAPETPSGTLVEDDTLPSQLRRNISGSI